MTESSKEVELVDLQSSGTTERNRFVSWERDVQRSTKSAVEIPSSKIALLLSPVRLARDFTKSIFAIPLRLLYASLKFVYGIAKFITMGLSSIRRLLFAPR